MTSVSFVPNAYSQRVIYSINDSWRFSKSDFPSSVNPDFDDSKCESVNVPHALNKSDVLDDLLGCYLELGLCTQTVTILTENKNKQLTIKQVHDTLITKIEEIKTLIRSNTTLVETIKRKYAISPILLIKPWVQPKRPQQKPLHLTMIDVLKKAGYEVIFPENIKQLCCGTIWESKGSYNEANSKSSELEKALLLASENGSFTVLNKNSLLLGDPTNGIKVNTDSPSDVTWVLKPELNGHRNGMVQIATVQKDGITTISFTVSHQ